MENQWICSAVEPNHRNRQNVNKEKDLVLEEGLVEVLVEALLERHIGGVPRGGESEGGGHAGLHEDRIFSCQVHLDDLNIVGDSNKDSSNPKMNS